MMARSVKVFSTVLVFVLGAAWAPAVERVVTTGADDGAGSFREAMAAVETGDVIVIPDETNRRFAHAVPHREGDAGRRVSVTLRGFEDA